MASRAAGDQRSERRARILTEAIAEGRAALRRQAARHAPDPGDAEDVLQEACVEFLRYYEGGPGEQAIAYLMVAVKHRAWALAAAGGGVGGGIEVTTSGAFEPERPGIAPPSDGPGPAERAERREHLATCLGLLARLKPDERTALLLHGLGYSYHEISALAGWTYTKVNRCLSEGRAALRALDPEAR